MMRVFCLVLIALYSAATTAQIGAVQVREMDMATEIIDRSGYTGTLVIFRESDGFYRGAYPERAHKALIPASTFKIVSAMVALDTGVIEDGNSVIAWDGVSRSRTELNKDLDLTTAFRVSAVPHFQTLVREIGPETMQAYIDALAYGNQDISGGDETFWLQGNLKISPVEQIQLLRRLYGDDLPVRLEVMKAVKEMMVSEQTDSYTIRSKTGLAVLEGEHNIGWWVGWIENGDERVFFASALEAVAPSADFIPARLRVVRELLETMGLFEKLTTLE